MSNDSVNNFRKMLKIFSALFIRATTKKPDDLLKGIETEKGMNPVIDGVGYKGGAIQKYIEDCCEYDFGRFCVSISAQRKSGYLHINGTGANIRYKYNKESNYFYLQYGTDGNTKQDDKIQYNDLSNNEKVQDFMKKYKQFYDKYKNRPLIELLKEKKNIILQGAPGTGKTYFVDELIYGLCGEDYDENDENHDNTKCVKYRKSHLFEIPEKENPPYEYSEDKNIAFCTFHQSMEYEDFIEGIKPKVVDEKVTYEIKKGLFWHFAQAAKNCYNKNKTDNENKTDPVPYILVIDEINRGNVSRIFGELITLLESGKRIDGVQPISVKLPYSNDEFELPPNLYIIGTMNTTDRSVGNLDYAIRRRFSFITMKTDRDAILKYYNIKDGELKKKAIALFDQINDDKQGFIISRRNDSEMDIEDLKIGHSYFMAENENELKRKMEYEVIPLIKEYINDGLLKKLGDEKKYYESWKKLSVVGNLLSQIIKNKNDNEKKIIVPLFEQIFGDDGVLTIESKNENTIKKCFNETNFKENQFGKFIKGLIEKNTIQFRDEAITKDKKESYIDSWNKLEVYEEKTGQS